MKVSVLLLSVHLLAVIFCSPRDDMPPKWSDTYTVKGVLIVPYAELQEPFHAWYDGPSKQSRIDYYGDMAKTYQLASVKPYGTSIKIVPVTSEESDIPVRTCLQVNGTEDDTIQPQSILPDLTGFQYMGEDILDGVSTNKWQLVQNIDQKTNKYTMWVRYVKDINDETKKITVPVRYSMKGLNNIFGNHYDHYYLHYQSYDDDNIDPEVFQLSKNMTCSSFPGPGSQHIYTFNPMAEFVHPVRTDHVDFEFDKFKRKHNKEYADIKEHEQRKDIFRQNLRYIHSVNRQNRGYSLGVNHLVDRNELELKALRGRRYSGVYNGGKSFPYKTSDMTDLPDQFDWRLHGAVTPVKDQSVCGSCWSFATVGAMEGAYFLKNGGHLVRLSQQALIDCSWGYGNNGCDGGEDFRSYKWILKHGGIPTEEDYGNYLSQDGYCHEDEVPKVAPISGWVNVTQNNEDALKLAIVKHGPVSVAMDANNRSFRFYSNGVYYEPNCRNRDDQLDHAVLAVGFGRMNGKDYWLIKNSWSNYWGNDGYVLMEVKDNNCGIMTTPTYVIM